ncbi:MAG: hypothetical protein KGL39_26180, partial [Patescibacteria group bacterium]|nr:hypothetical protein [Patescibacteria group bacterium]
FLLAFPLLAHAATIIVTCPWATPTQIVCQYPNQGSASTISVSASGGSTGHSIPFADTNATIYSSSNLDTSRTSTVVGSTTTTVTLGLRTAQIGSDGLSHSRSAETGATYTITITNGGNSGSATVKTSWPFLGNTFAEPQPFDASQPFNLAWPTMRPIIDRGTWFTDPQTGYAFTPVTTPVPVNNNGQGVQNASGIASFDSTATWTLGCNNVTNTTCVDSTANQTPVFLRLQPNCAGYGATPGGGLQAPGSNLACPQGQTTQASGGQSGGQTYYTSDIDDIQVKIPCSVSGATTGMQFALTVDGVNPATDWQSQTCTGSTVTYTYPPTGTASGGSITQAGYPSTQFGTGNNHTVFGYWVANFNNLRMARVDLQPHTGTLTVSGTTATWASGEYFRMSSCSAGSYITLVVGGVNTDYQISACNSPTSLALSSAPANGTYNYIYQQLGILVRKPAATTGNLTIGIPTYSQWESAPMTMPISGVVDICASYTVTDGSGHVLLPCMALEGFAHPIYLIDVNTGVSRFLGLAEQNGGCFTNNCSPGVTNSLNNYTQPNSGALGQTFLATHNHWSLGATDASGNLVAIDGSYNPSGSGTCPNGYAEITAVNCSTYPWNDNMSFYNATPKVGSDAMDHTPIAAATAYATAHSISGFYPSQLVQNIGGDPTDLTNGWVEFQFPMGGQNYPAWFVKLDPASSYAPVAMGNTYSSVNCRFCGNHGSASLSGYEGIATENTVPACSGVGCGPFVLQTTTSTDNSTQNVCSGITDAAYTSFNGQSRCFTLTLSGLDPCHTTPNGTEVAPMYGTCSWNGSYTHWTGITVMVGDLLGDSTWVSNGGPPGEMFRVVSISGSNIQVIRAYGTPAVTLGQNASSGVLTAHTAPWQLEELCSASAGTNGGQSWFNLNTDPTAQTGTTDYPALITGHLDYWTTGVWEEAGGRYRVASSIGTMIGAPNSFLTSGSEGTFNGVGAVNLNYLQSHGAVSRDSTKPLYDVDANPYANGSAVSTTLWSQTANLVSGSLWHIAAANVHNGGATWPAAIKSVPFFAWAGGYLLHDVSGPSSSISSTSADNWKFCIVYIAGECTAGSSLGDVYLNIPESAHGANTGGCEMWDYVRAICGTLADQIGGGINRNDFSTASLGTCGVGGGCTTYGGGSFASKVSTLGNRPGMWSLYASAHGVSDGKWSFGHTDYYGGANRSDIVITANPPSYIAPPSTSQASFISYTVPSAQKSICASTYCDARFCYAENGCNPSSGSLTGCTPRADTCLTAASPSSSSPFYFGSDTTPSFPLTASTLTIPAVPGRVLYYTVESRNSGGAVVATSEVYTVAPGFPAGTVATNRGVSGPGLFAPAVR